MVAFCCHTTISGATTNTGTSTIPPRLMFISLTVMLPWVYFSGILRLISFCLTKTAPRLRIQMSDAGPSEPSSHW